MLWTIISKAVHGKYREKCPVCGGTVMRMRLRRGQHRKNYGVTLPQQ